MSFILFPDVMYESAFSVDYEGLYAEGIRCILFDIDNTLVGHGEPMDERALALIQGLKKQGFIVITVSNNREGRVKSFCAPADIKYIYKAGKPSGSGIKRAMSMAGCGLGETALIGDQLFTDMAGAKMAGIKAVLVRPLFPKEEIQIVLKRLLERPIIFMFRLLHRDRCRT